MIDLPVKYIRQFEAKDIHKKFGKIIVIEPGDSDYQEGNFMAQIWFVDKDFNMYLLMEKDVREK